MNLKVLCLQKLYIYKCKRCFESPNFTFENKSAGAGDRRKEQQQKNKPLSKSEGLTDGVYKGKRSVKWKCLGPGDQGTGLSWSQEQCLKMKVAMAGGLESASCQPSI
jgi:hypothetical protein